jgi:hypothetical protein
MGDDLTLTPAMGAGGADAEKAAGLGDLTFAAAPGA